MIKFFSTTKTEDLKNEYNIRLVSNYYTNLRLKNFKDLIIRLSDGNVLDYSNKLFQNNGGLLVTISTTKDSFRKNLANWKSGKGCPPYVKNLHKKDVSNKIDNRAKFIDLLLYLGVHKRYTENKLVGFNAELRKFGIEPLYELDFFDFCVAVSIYLEEQKAGEAYVIFRQLFNDKMLSTLASLDISGQGTFTLKIKEDFDKIKEVGTLQDIYENGKFKKNKDVKNAYQFVLLYASEFGRRHVSRYFAFATLLCGCDVDYIIDEIKTKNTKKTIAFKNLITGTIQNSTLLEVIKDQLVVEQVQHSLYLISEKMFLSCAEYLHDDCVQLYDSGFFGYEFDEEDKLSRSLSPQEKKEEVENHRSHHKNIQSGQVLDITASQFSKMMEKKENISREMMLMTILTSISVDTIKKYIDRYESNDGAIDKMIANINTMLNQCRMAELNEDISQYDFLLLTAIHKINYVSLVNEPDDVYPFRKFIFEEFLQ